MTSGRSAFKCNPKALNSSFYETCSLHSGSELLNTSIVYSLTWCWWSFNKLPPVGWVTRFSWRQSFPDTILHLVGSKVESSLVQHFEKKLPKCFDWEPRFGKKLMLDSNSFCCDFKEKCKAPKDERDSSRVIAETQDLADWEVRRDLRSTEIGCYTIYSGFKSPRFKYFVGQFWHCYLTKGKKLSGSLSVS